MLKEEFKNGIETPVQVSAQYQTDLFNKILVLLAKASRLVL